jgi:succinate dehydrogenase / fumarate reductase cytochrome b subunit
MNWFTATLKSSIGRKLVMGITGLFLILFLIVHCGVNALIFLNDGGELFNIVAHFMGTNFFVRAMEIVLFLGLIWHILQSLVVTIENNKARSGNYIAFNNSSKWYSRSMGLLGTLILIFLVLHLAHFWVKSRFTGLEEITYENATVGNLFLVMEEVFSYGWIVIVYVLSMISLSYHLMHGFQSAFQTLGMNHKKYTPLIQWIGIAFSIIVPVVFAAMPVAMYFKWV